MKYPNIMTQKAVAVAYDAGVRTWRFDYIKYNFFLW